MKDTVLIFDLDGTVLDTGYLVEQSFRYAFHEFRPDLELSDDVILSMFGPTLEDSFGRFLDAKDVPHAIATYRDFNFKHHRDMAKTYPHEEEVLKELKKRGYPLAILTTKRQDAAEYGLSLFGLDHYFDLIIGMEQQTRHKPDPEGVYMIMEQQHVNQAVMIGDNVSDVMAGINAQQKGIGVSWSAKRDELKAVSDLMIDSFDDLLTLFD